MTSHRDTVLNLSPSEILLRVIREYCASQPAVCDGYKRVLDPAIIIIGHIVFAPIFLLLWILIPLAIKMEDGGQVFYRQHRIGKNGRIFSIIKFRSMVEDAEKTSGPMPAAGKDPRITRTGMFLRWTHLDELPQVLNIMKGEMSLVGPRPDRIELLVDLLHENSEYDRSRHQALPGITGLAQIRGSYESKLKDKGRYDSLYIKHMGPLLDLKILLFSPFVVFAGKIRGKR